eukprot:TRINITY_DN72567_c0_g1_i1.p1 TRINITY_DN72567_c0_g1~~TRINITY_DN72567_c0_g1_i1.p1  ORF type:complete len:731 (+),score=87.18 TRINITY_DN72567_c0_g1_i1:47-2194(+)
MEPRRMQRMLDIMRTNAKMCLQSPPSKWRAALHRYSRMTCYILLMLAGFAGAFVHRFGPADSSLNSQDEQRAKIFGLLGTVGVGTLGVIESMFHHRKCAECIKEAVQVALATTSHLCLLYYSFRLQKLNEASLIWKALFLLFGWDVKSSMAFVLIVFAANAFAFDMHAGHMQEGVVEQLAFNNTLYCIVSLVISANYNYILLKCYCSQELAKSEHETFQNTLTMMFDSQIWVSTMVQRNNALSMTICNHDIRFEESFGLVNHSRDMSQFIAPDDLGRVTEAFRSATASIPILCEASLWTEPNQNQLPVELLITRQRREFVQDTFVGAEESKCCMHLVNIRLTNNQENQRFHVQTSEPDDEPALVRNLLHPKVGRRGPPSLCASSDHQTTFTGMVFQDGLQDLETVRDLGEQEHWIVPDEFLQLSENVLGSGGFGCVVESSYYGAAVAVKIVRRNGRAAITSLLHELRLLRKLRHPNIMAFYGASIDKDMRAVRLVFEKAHLGPLDVFVGSAFTHIGGGTDRYTELCLSILLQVAQALHYLHQQVPKIVHGDLKPSNVLLQGSPDGSCLFHAMLADFGLSRRLTKNAKPMGRSLRWAAPEVAGSNACMPSTSTDVFSFGRLMYFVASARKPFEGTTLTSELVASGLDYAEWPASRLAALCMVIAQKCLNIDATLRCSITQVRQDLSDAMDSLNHSSDESSDDDNEQAAGTCTRTSL